MTPPTDPDLARDFEPLRVAFAVCALLLGLLVAGSADAFAAGPGSGELRWHGIDGSVHSAASLETRVRMHVHGMVAEVTVEQRFRNPTPDWLEAEYMLPLPDAAAVYDLTLHIGERVIVGEIREREAARRAFVAARTSGRQAALVEAGGDNLFRTAVTNVAPDETVSVELRYWQRLDYRDGWFALRYPLTYTPRYTMQHGSALQPPVQPADPVFAAADTGKLAATIEVTLDAGLPLAKVISPSHDILVTREGDYWQAALRAESVVPDRDFVLRWKAQPSSMPRVASFTQTVGGDHYAMLMVMPPEQDARSLPREMILVIDTSGSMGGESIRQARAALDIALTQLGPRDRFNVIEFNSHLRAWRQAAVPATPALVAGARDWVAALQARGGTEMEPALRLALEGEAPEGYVRQIVFATDAAVANPAGLLSLIDAQLGNSRLFPIGIGSAPNEGFLRAAARHGRGSWTLIADISEVTSAMRRLTARLTHPAVRNLAIDWPQGTVAYPAPLPDLYLGEPLLVTARLPQPVDGVSIAGELVEREWITRVGVGDGDSERGLDRLWASARIDDLESRLARGGDPAELRPLIVETALAAKLVSRFTSLVAVDKTPVRSAEAALVNDRIANALPAGSRFAGTASGSRMTLLLALFALIAAAGFRWLAIRPEAA